MSHKKQPNSRRELLKFLGTSLGLPLVGHPITMLIEAVVNGSLQMAHADVMGLNPRRFLQIMHPGGPLKTTFDHFLIPYNTNRIHNIGVSNRYVGSSTQYTSVDYATISRKGLNAPPIWQYQVPKSGGGTRPIDELMN